MNAWKKCPYCKRIGIIEGVTVHTDSHTTVVDATCICGKIFYVYYFSDGEFRVVGREQP